MTAPVFMAAPPEVHSALLSSGPGPGSLVAAAGAWNSLSTEYTSVAEELSALLANVQSGAWQGPSAESFIAAFVPYLAWLTLASANSAAAATQHETVATAYTAALAAMPTMPELAANHMVHGVLVATNFFGINTIPIAVNEADYVRMWIQAATTMSAYQATTAAAVAATPSTDPAPTIQKSSTQSDPSSAAELNGDNPLGIPQSVQNFLNELGISNTQVAHDPTIDNAFDNMIANFLQNFGYTWDPSAGTLNGATYDTYTNPGQMVFWVARVLELTEDFQQFGQDLVTNPVAAFQYLVSLELFDWPLHIEEIGLYLAQNPLLLAVAASPALAPAGAGALGGLAGLAAIPPPTAAPAPAPPAPQIVPVPVTAPTVSGVAGVAAGTPPGTSPAPVNSTVASPAAAPAPPPATGGTGFVPPYVLGPPGIGSRSGMSLGAKTQEPSSRGAARTPEVGAAAAAASARTRERRRRQAQQQDSGDKFMDMNVEVDPDWAASPKESTVASDHGAGNFGFAGTLSKSSEQAAGLATLSGDEFGGGPTMPMLPNTWGEG